MCQCVNLSKVQINACHMGKSQGGLKKLFHFSDILFHFIVFHDYNYCHIYCTLTFKYRYYVIIIQDTKQRNLNLNPIGNHDKVSWKENVSLSYREPVILTAINFFTYCAGKYPFIPFFLPWKWNSLRIDTNYSSSPLWGHFSGTSVFQDLHNLTITKKKKEKKLHALRAITLLLQWICKFCKLHYHIVFCGDFSLLKLDLENFLSHTIIAFPIKAPELFLPPTNVHHYHWAVQSHHLLQMLSQVGHHRAQECPGMQSWLYISLKRGFPNDNNVVDSPS